MDQENPRLLVVDDDQFNRDMLKRHLNANGISQIEFAENGREALDRFQTDVFDLVLLDLEMPEMDGMAVLERIKADMRKRDTPVIMISGVEEIDQIAKCIELGAEDFLPKPFNSTILRARVGASLEKKRLRDQERSHREQIRIAKKKADELLAVILPSAAASELKATGAVVPRTYDDVAVLFCDIVGFTSFCNQHEAKEVVSHLQTLFEQFESIAQANGLEKTKTIGDEFMATAGLMLPNGDPLVSTVRAAFQMVDSAANMDVHWEVRSGVHIGPLVAGIVGRDRYQFDVWGETVNTAARMTSIAKPGTVALTYDAWLRVEDECEGQQLGVVKIKGIGNVEVVEVTGMR